MTIAEFVALASLQLLILGWLLRHIGQCNEFHERVAKLEQWKEGQSEDRT